MSLWNYFTTTKAGGDAELKGSSRKGKTDRIDEGLKDRPARQVPEKTQSSVSVHDYAKQGD